MTEEQVHNIGNIVESMKCALYHMRWIAKLLLMDVCYCSQVWNGSDTFKENNLSGVPSQNFTYFHVTVVCFFFLIISTIKL